MSNSEYLIGEIYHMIHINNLCSVFRSGLLLSKNELQLQEITYNSIAYETVQNLRDRVFIKDIAARKYRSLHYYVPFYFTPKSPMFYVQRKNGLEEQLAFLVISRDILKEKGILFTDGNAAMQKLSAHGTEKVGITPAMSATPCIREYRPDGPYGASQAMSNIYCDIALLSKINWSVVNGSTSLDWEESKRVRSSEVLIPHGLNVNMILQIAVKHAFIAQNIRNMFARNNLMNYAHLITARPDLF